MPHAEPLFAIAWASLSPAVSDFPSPLSVSLFALSLSLSGRPLDHPTTSPARALLRMARRHEVCDMEK